MKKLISAIFTAGIVFFVPIPAFAASNTEVAHFADESLTGIIIIASIATVFFLVKAGYIYI